LDDLMLNIGFSHDLSAVTLDFATNDFNVASPLTLTAYENSQLIGSAQSTGQFLSGFTFPEGEIAFQGAPFNRIVISSTAADFAVDNLAVAPTPEPGLFALIAIGLAAIVIRSLRAKSGAKAA
jgi:hypothetical protein